MEKLLVCMGRKWAYKVMNHLATKKELRFGDVKRITGNVATANRVLKDLSKHGLVKKRELKDNLGTVMYSLTETGIKVADIFKQMKKI